MYIYREITPYLERLAKIFPVVLVTGPRQSGKSTLVQEMFPQYLYVNMENPQEREKAKADMEGFLSRGPMIIDEVQRMPILLEFVQAIVDREKTMGQFVLTGSNQPELFEKVSESLAGRVGIAELMPLSFSELKGAGFDVLDRNAALYRGFMPRLHAEAIAPNDLYSSYFRTYVERDVRKLVNVADLDLFETFVQLLAGRVGQLVNKQSLAKDVGVSEMTIARWITVLRTSYIVFPLRPYHNNFGKRITKTPKIYFTDTGLVAYLLGIRSPSDLATHPLMGNIFENMVVADAFKTQFNCGKHPNLYFYRNSSGSIEVDLLREEGQNLYAYEIKASTTFGEHMTRGIKSISVIAPNIKRGTVIYSGGTMSPLAVNYSDIKSIMTD